jgi:hypothetical protein
LFRWELEDLAREQLAGMPPAVQLALSDFMDAVVIVDPAEYQRRPDEPERPLRTLPFGQAGLVTFLVYEPDDLVLVTRVIWIGWPVRGLRATDGVRGRGQFHRAVTAGARTYSGQAGSLSGQLAG